MKPMVEATYQDVSPPALVLIGERTPPSMPASAEHAARTLPRAKSAELPGQGHLAVAFAPESFCSEVLRFVDDTSSER